MLRNWLFGVLWPERTGQQARHEWTYKGLLGTVFITQVKALMSRSPLTHQSTRRSPSLSIPRSRSGTFVDNAGSPHCFPHHRTSRGTHRGLGSDGRQWPSRPSNRKFWIYESSSPGSSQDGKSSSSSGGKSVGSETTEERRVRTGSPYGSFFAEEMESDTPAEKLKNNMNRSFRQGDDDNTSGVFLPTRKVPSRNWAPTSAQAQIPPVFFTTTGYRAVPALQQQGPDQYHYHEASSNNMTEMPVSALFLAENSRRSHPPLSWRQGFPDHSNHPQLGCSSQYDPHQVAAAVPCDKRQTDARDGSTRQR